MTDCKLIENSLRPEDTASHRDLQDALREDHGDDSEFVVEPPPGWVEPDAPPPTVDDLEGSPRWSWDELEGAVSGAKRAYYEHDHRDEMMYIALMRSGA